MLGHGALGEFALGEGPTPEVVAVGGMVAIALTGRPRYTLPPFLASASFSGIAPAIGGPVDQPKWLPSSPHPVWVAVGQEVNPFVGSLPQIPPTVRQQYNPIQIGFVFDTPSNGWIVAADYRPPSEPIRVTSKDFLISTEPFVPISYSASLDVMELGDFIRAVLYGFNVPVDAYVDIITKNPHHRGNLGIIENVAQSSIVTGIVEPQTVPTSGAAVAGVASARVAIILR